MQSKGALSIIDLAALEGEGQNNKLEEESLARRCKQLKAPVTVVIANNRIMDPGAC